MQQKVLKNKYHPDPDIISIFQSSCIKDLLYLVYDGRQAWVAAWYVYIHVVLCLFNPRMAKLCFIMEATK